MNRGQIPLDKSSSLLCLYRIHCWKLDAGLGEPLVRPSLALSSILMSLVALKCTHFLLITSASFKFIGINFLGRLILLGHSSMQILKFNILLQVCSFLCKFQCKIIFCTFKLEINVNYAGKEHVENSSLIFCVYFLK